MDDKTGLDPQQIETLRERLAARRAELAAQIGTRLHSHGLMTHEEAALPRRSEDTDDEAMASAQRDTDVAQLSAAAREIADIDAALARLGEGSYGDCEDCGGPIAAARLLAYPTARRCAVCQTAYEKKRGPARTAR
jgi:RNA polymerase-binding protein DksA